MELKIDDYLAFGVRHIWVIDPANRNSYRFHEGQLDLSSAFGSVGEPIHFSISEIEKLLD